MTNSEPRTAATVVLVRDGPQGPETLLLRRNKALMFAGGLWVFPGGALDPEDWEAGAGDEARAARHGAAREAAEEAGVDVDADTMVQISHWTTPTAEPKRFYTWIFLALASPDSAIEIDGGEIHDFMWIGIADAVQRHEAGELGLLPPTIMTLRSLLGYMTAEDALIGMAARSPHVVLPVFAKTGDSLQVMFAGDSGYESGDPDNEGQQHRAILQGKTWVYVHRGLGDNVPRLDH